MKTFDVVMRNKFVLLGTAAAILLAAGDIAFSTLFAADAHAAAPAVAPATQTWKPESLRVWSSISGRMQAVDYAAIGPEVSGRITQIRFKDGPMCTQVKC